MNSDPLILRSAHHSEAAALFVQYRIDSAPVADSGALLGFSPTAHQPAVTIARPESAVDSLKNREVITGTRRQGRDLVYSNRTASVMKTEHRGIITEPISPGRGGHNQRCSANSSHHHSHLKVISVDGSSPLTYSTRGREDYGDEGGEPAQKKKPKSFPISTSPGKLTGKAAPLQKSRSSTAYIMARTR